MIQIGTESFANCPELTDVYCYAENVPAAGADAFQGSYINGATLHVPAASVAAYKAAFPWSGFKEIVALEGKPVETPKCAAPAISYANGKLTFSSETEGAEFISSVTDSDIKNYYEAEIQLSATYDISVYATKVGYDNSDTITATLYFTSASLNAPSGISSAKATAAVLIQRQGSTLHVTGVEEGTDVDVFTLDGGHIGHSKSSGGTADIELNGVNKIVIVKVGNASIKVRP